MTTSCGKSLLKLNKEASNSSSEEEEDCSIETELINEYPYMKTIASSSGTTNKQTGKCYTDANSDDEYCLKPASTSSSSNRKFLKNFFQSSTKETITTSGSSSSNSQKLLMSSTHQQQQIEYAAKKIEECKLSITSTSAVASVSSPSCSSTTKVKNRFADECEYRMNNRHRGVAIIINNKKFHSNLDMPTRAGTDRDAASLQQTFYKLGFEVKLEHNKSANDIREYMSRLAKADHSEADCFVCCLLSHGEEGVIYGTDQSIEIESLIAPFKFNRSLAGKPKLFFIQACRGTKLMDGIDTNPYSIQYVNKIPMEADFLIAYSTVSGYYSWRNSVNGSWFIQSLCEVLNENGTSLEIMQLLTCVNRKVAYYFESNANELAMSGKKQIPCIVSMLTKELYFKTKHSLQCTDI